MPRRYSEEEVLELLKEWDYYVSWKDTVRGRLNEAGIQMFRDRNEIDNSLHLDEWLDNRFWKIIESYASATGRTMEESQAALLARPYIDVSANWKQYFGGGDPAPVGTRKRVPKLRVTLKTSKEGWNTWTFRSHPEFKMKVWERSDKLYQAEGNHGIGVGQSLSNAVIGVREKADRTSTYMEKYIEFVNRVLHYFKTQVEV